MLPVAGPLPARSLPAAVQSSALYAPGNHSDATSSYRIEQVTISGGSLGPVRTLDAAAGFKGYTSALEHAGPGERPVVLWSWQRTLNQGGAIIEATTVPR